MGEEIEASARIGTFLFMGEAEVLCVFVCENSVCTWSQWYVISLIKILAG